MLRILLVTTLLATPLAAQDSTDHSTMDHTAHMGTEAAAPMGMVAGMDMNANVMTEPGQSAFAAVEEIVAALVADPMTDWSKVDINALREHLVDMELVFTEAKVTTNEIGNSMLFDVTGEGRVALAIQNMAPAHAGVMEGVDGWSYTATLTENGATLAVTVPEGDLAKLRALGFFGIMATGGHHQAHHWAMASGVNPHAGHN